MKQRTAAIICAAVMGASLLAGCGTGTANSAAAASSSSSAQASATEETASSAASSGSSAASAASSGSSGQSSETVSGSALSSASASEGSEVPADGTYTADFTTDSPMFKVNEANDGKGTLTVKDGKMVIHVSLTSENIVNLFAGTKEDAQKDGAELLQPTVDTVTYSDGTSEEVYGFDIPVPALDKEFSVALIGKKGKWYDHKVTVTNPVPKA
ncbi:MAG: hypothetical protein ACOYBD_04380 [Bilifractor sp.]|jgi:hypothetical protein